MLLVSVVNNNSFTHLYSFLRTASAFQHSVFQFKHALIEKVKAGFNEQNKKILYLKFHLFEKTRNPNSTKKIRTILLLCQKFNCLNDFK